MTDRERFELWTRTDAPKRPDCIKKHNTYEFWSFVWQAWQAGQQHLRDELLTALLESSDDTELWNRFMKLHEDTKPANQKKDMKSSLSLRRLKKCRRSIKR